MIVIMTVLLLYNNNKDNYIYKNGYNNKLQL